MQSDFSPESIRRVLVVEDSQTHAHLIKTLLEQIGPVVEVESSLAGAIDKACKLTFDAVILDLMLPDSQGIATVIEIKQKLPNTPIIVLTNVDDESMGLEALKRGAADYLVKGEVSSKSLVRSIRYGIERQRATDELNRAQSNLKTVLEMAYDSFLAIDAFGVIVEWNEMASAQLGYEREEIVGKNFLDRLVPERYRQELEEGIREFADHGTGSLVNKRVELSLLASCKAELQVELAFFRLQDADQPVLCTFLQDITERKKAEQRMREFYSVVAHELRSPLTSIRGALGLMEGGVVGELPEGAYELVQIARTDCDHLTRLVSDLLDLGKIEAGMMELRLLPMDPAELAQRALRSLGGLAARSGVRLISRIDARKVIQADADRLIQVITNLVSNAIKFSPESSEVTIAVSEIDNNRVRFSVTDHGPGIDKSQQYKLFEKFQQLDSTDGRKHGGTGLGLAISRALVRQHQGEIGVESAAGQGCTFWFELPVHPDSPR